MNFKKFGLAAILTGVMVMSAGLSAAQDNTISYGGSVQGVATANQPAQFTFEGAAGDVITAVASGTGVTDVRISSNSTELQAAALELFGSGAQDDGTQAVRAGLVADGQYIITVEVGTDAGFMLSLLKNETTLDDGAQYVHLTEAHPSQVLTFTGTAGEKINVHMAQPSRVFVMGRPGEGIALPDPHQMPEPQMFSREAGALDMPAVKISASQNSVILAEALETPAMGMIAPMNGQPPMIDQGQLPPMPADGEPAMIQMGELPADDMPPLPTTTLELIIPVDGEIQITVSADSFPQVPEGASVELEPSLDRQVYIERVG